MYPLIRLLKIKIKNYNINKACEREIGNDNLFTNTLFEIFKISIYLKKIKCCINIVLVFLSNLISIPH